MADTYIIPFSFVNCERRGEAYTESSSLTCRAWTFVFSYFLLNSTYRDGS